MVWGPEGARLWSSNDCSTARGVDLRTLVPGQPVVFAVTWAGRTSFPGCTGVRNDRQIPTSVVKTGTTVDYAALTKAAGQDVPPTSGPRDATPLPDTPQFYAYSKAPRPERVHRPQAAW